VRVLLVEDDDRVAAALTDLLRRHGVVVSRAATGQQALAGADVDLVLLDLGLPDMDGAAVCRALRRSSAVPIIAVTARGEERDRVLLLRTGVDDYVVKPYSSAELLARIEAVIRRTRHGPAAPAPRRAVPAPGEGVLHAGPLDIDPDSRRVTAHGAELQLSRKEFDILLVLARAGGAVCTRETLLDQVWGATLFGSTRTLDVHIATLRAKLAECAADGADLVETVRGVGHRLRVPTPRS
jgi:two-component system, OmpR family, response regulator RegX3